MHIFFLSFTEKSVFKNMTWQKSLIQHVKQAETIYSIILLPKWTSLSKCTPVTRSFLWIIDIGSESSRSIGHHLQSHSELFSSCGSDLHMPIVIRGHWKGLKQKILSLANNECMCMMKFLLHFSKLFTSIVLQYLFSFSIRILHYYYKIDKAKLK